MGRRRRPHRTYRVPVRFTAEELAVARRNAYATGRPLARFMRERAIGTVPRSLRFQVQDDVIHEVAAVIRQLDGSGNGAAKVVPRAVAALRALLARLTT